MAWDSRRPVPWERLAREWLIYTVVMAVVFALFFRDRLSPGPFIGLLASGPIYIVIGAVLAKFGYQRTTLREAREAARQRAATQRDSQPAVAAPRPKPAPTRRTSGGGNRNASRRR